MPSAPAFQTASARSAVAQSATVSIAVPSGVVAGNTVICAFSCDPKTTTVTSPASGFTEATGSPQLTSGSNPFGVHVFIKKVTASDTGTYNFGLSSSSTWHTGFAARYSGADTTTPLDTATSGVSTTTAIANTSLTTANANELLVWIVFNGSGGATATPPSGFTNNIAASGDAAVYFASKAQATAGATGTISGTWTTAWDNTVWLGALKPPASATSSVYVRSGSVWVPSQPTKLRVSGAWTTAQDPHLV